MCVNVCVCVCVCERERERDFSTIDMYDFPNGLSSKQSACEPGDSEMQVGSLGQEEPLEEGMSTHSSVLAWRIPWTEEPGGQHPWGHKEWGVTEHAQIYM